jgi:hypothetical protein
MPGGGNWVLGEYLAQLDNRDPFRAPVWRSPVYRTPEAVILVVQLLRLAWRVGVIPNKNGPAAGVRY